MNPSVRNILNKYLGWRTLQLRLLKNSIMHQLFPHQVAAFLNKMWKKLNTDKFD